MFHSLAAPSTASHLWPMTNTVLDHQHFATLDALEDVQAERCIAMQAQRDLVHSTTCFHWWPRRLRTLHQRSISWLGR
jgi:hypothetical protein